MRIRARRHATILIDRAPIGRLYPLIIIVARSVNSKKIWLLAALIGVLGIFSPLFTAQFTNWDDPTTIVHNPLLAPPLLNGFEAIWSRAQAHLYVPATYTLWWITSTITGGTTGNASPHWFHALNIVIHLIATTFVFLLLRLLVQKDWPAALGAFFFAVYPVQVEAVAWCSGTKDLLAGMFALASLYLLLRGLKAARHPLRWMIAATILYALALLSKPSAVILPLLAIVLMLWMRGKDTRKIRGLGWRTIFFIPLIWLLMAVPIVIVGRLAQPVQALQFDVPLHARPIIAADALLFYLHHLVVPFSLVPDYGQSPLHVLSQPATFWKVCLVFIIFGAIFLLRRKQPWLALGAVIFILSLLPVLGLAQFDFQHYSTTADHYLYLAMLGPAIFVAGLARRRVAGYVLIPILIFLCLLSIRQCTLWKNSITLFTHNLAVNPTSGASHVNLAIALAERGQWQAAYAHYWDALKLDFTNPRAQLGVGQILAMAHHPAQALPHLRAAAKLEPEDPLTHYELAVLVAKMNQPDQAIQQYKAALAINPRFAEAQVNLATILLLQGHLDAARKHYQAALEINPHLDLARRGLQEIDRQEK